MTTNAVIGFRPFQVRAWVIQRNDLSQQLVDQTFHHPPPPAIARWAGTIYTRHPAQCEFDTQTYTSRCWVGGVSG